MTGDVNKLFLDTNILIYASVTDSPFHQIAREKIRFFQRHETELWISLQVIREYICVLSKPNFWPIPIRSSDLLRDIEFFQRNFQIAAEDDFVLKNLMSIMERHNVAGKQIHDANIVATMVSNHIKAILTHNIKDFARFSDYISIIPLQEE